MPSNRLTRWMLAAGLCLAAAARTPAANYTITTAPGWNLIANQLDRTNGNTIRNVILRPPVGSQLRRFNLSSNRFDTLETFVQSPLGGSAWTPGTSILNPGDGLLFFNPTTTSADLVISGNPHVPKLPLRISGLALVARQTNDNATVDQILGFAPADGTAVFRFIPGPGHDPEIFSPANYTIYVFKGRTWVTPPGPPPAFNIGESVWITTNSVPPTIQQPPATQTACLNSPVNFTVIAAGTPPLSYQWLFQANPIAEATSNTFTIKAATAANAGAYSVRVTNPFGSTTSAVATLAVGDKTPPVLTCPKDIVTGCRGPGGTLVTFKVDITDDCDPRPVAVCNPPSGTTFPAGVTTVVCTGTDASGNKSACSFSVTVIDDIPPVIVCPPDRMVSARSPEGASVFYTVSASDNCDTNVVVDCVPPSGSIFPLGVTVVTCKATDTSGRSSTCTFRVTVIGESCCDSKAWKQLDVTSPGGRYGHMMAYDAIRSKTVLFGGQGPNTLMSDTWEWDGQTWTKIPAEGPAARSNAAMAFDAKLGRVVMHGGRAGTAVAFDDTWLWNGTSWQLAQAGSVGARFNHAMAYDEARGVVVLYGGAKTNGTELLDTWEFDGTKWVQATGSSFSPGALQGHAMAYGAAQSQLLLFGGQSKLKPSSETWQWDGKSWKMLSKEGPPARAFHAMTYNDTCEAITLFGGGTNGLFSLDDTWAWDGKAWTLEASKQPTARGMTALAHDSLRGETFLFGGTRTLKEWFGDTWTYNTAGGIGPSVLSVDAVCSENTIIIVFDGPVSEASAENPANYAVACAGVQNTVTQAELLDGSRIVRLTVAAPLTSQCVLFINGVQDLCGRPMRPYQKGIECRVDPCTHGASGTEFWLTFPGNYVIDPAVLPQPQLFISGNVGTIGTVSIPGLSPAFSTPFAIPPSGIAQVALPREADLGDILDSIQTNAVHVVASSAVSVYGLNHLPFTTDAYGALSTRAIGKTYMVMGYGNLLKAVPDLNGSQFAIAATADGTKVAIQPAADVESHPAGAPFIINLMKGQTYQLRATNDAPADITGTIIVADKPIAVFGGHRSGTAPNDDLFFANHMVEQMPPADSWGAHFLTMPLKGRSLGDTFRILAVTDGTQITTNGVPIAGLVNHGKFIEIRLTGPSRIDSSKPVLVAQIANSSDFDSIPNSDPFMVILPPIGFYSSSYTVPAPHADFKDNFLNLIVPNGSTAQVVLDGAPLPAAGFSAIGGSGFSGAQVPVSVGPHNVHTTSAAPFGLVAYGWALYDAYGFAGQSCGIQQTSTPPRFVCPPDAITIPAGPGCVAAAPDLAKLVGEGSTALLLSQDPPPGTILFPGTNLIQLTATDVSGAPRVCRTIVRVTQGETGGLQCPLDIVTNCSPVGGGQTVFYNVYSCGTNTTVTCKPPSGSLFPVGTTPVICTAKNAAGLTETCQFTVTVICKVVSNRARQRLTITLAEPGAHLLTVNWTGPGILENADTVNGPWVPVPAAKPPYQITPSKSAGFYRIRSPE